MANEPVVINIHDSSARESTGRRLNFHTAEFSGDEDERLIKLAFTRATKQERYSPRHRHNFDQVRFVVSGELEYGPLKCRPGDCIYFPEGVFYGPTQLITENAENYTIQSQGPSWAHLLTAVEEQNAMADLAHDGVLAKNKGVFHWANGKNQDSYEAMWERVAGRRLAYPAARFDSPVLIRSGNFSWVPANLGSEVHVKQLAGFNEYGPRIKLLKVGPKGKLSRGKTDDHQINIVVSGVANFEGRRLTAGTVLYYRPSCSYPEIAAEDEVVMLTLSLQSKKRLTLGSIQ